MHAERGKPTPLVAARRLGTNQERRLVFISAGDRHRLRRGVRSNRDFDVVIAFYGDSRTVRRKLERRGVVHDSKGGKFQNLKHLIEHRSLALDAYDAVLVMDDDLSLSGRSITRLFDIRSDNALWIVQPSFDWRSRVTYPYSQTRRVTSIRFTNFVELTAPLFSRPKLNEFLNCYDGTLVGWGIDHWYMNVLGEDEPRRYAIADTVSCTNPDYRRQTRTREIDRLQPAAYRKAAWESLRDERKLHEVRPAVRDVRLATLSQQLAAAARTAYVLVLCLFTPPARKRTLLRVYAHLKPSN